MPQPDFDDGSAGAMLSLRAWCGNDADLDVIQQAITAKLQARFPGDALFLLAAAPVAKTA